MAERSLLEVCGLDGKGQRGVVGMTEVTGWGHHGKETCFPYWWELPHARAGVGVFMCRVGCSSQGFDPSPGWLQTGH